MGTATGLPQARRCPQEKQVLLHRQLTEINKKKTNPPLHRAFSLAKHLGHQIAHPPKKKQESGGCTVEEEALKQLVPRCPKH